MTAILGRKIGMTVKFDDGGKQVPLTVIQAGPCKVLQQKTAERDGYQAAVIGFEEVEGSKLKNRSLLGMFKKLGTPVYKVVREFRGLDAEAGSDLKVDGFSAGDNLQIEGVSRGKGWASAVKRWHFSTGRNSHGGKFVRALGGTGMCEFPGRVFKGRKMSGRMGGDKVTTRGIEVIDIIPEDNLLIVKGPVVGGENGLLKITKIGEAKKAA
jgi:large subunit ribosomal protein L3